MNGINCPISLNRTFRTAKNNPKPNDVMNVKITNNGMKMILTLKGCWKNADKSKNIPNVIKKSTNPTATELNGISNLGKYTFETKFELIKMLLLI
tara:strand:+ start:731 stop:1015 length:285 start_codon:yes stop_codon:yes gene_type:complete